MSDNHLTAAQIDVLIDAGEFVKAGEWPWENRRPETLDRALDTLRATRHVLAAHEKDCAHFRDFFNRYGLPQKLPPSCIVCGGTTPEPSIRHAELPSIVVCTACRDAAVRAIQDKQHG